MKQQTVTEQVISRVSHPLVTETVVELELDPDSGDHDVSPNDTQTHDLGFLAIDSGQEPDAPGDTQEPADTAADAKQPPVPIADAIDNAQQPQLPIANATDNDDDALADLDNSDDTIDYNIDAEQCLVKNFVFDTEHPDDDADWPVTCKKDPAEMVVIHELRLNDFTEVITGYQGPNITKLIEFFQLLIQDIIFQEIANHTNAYARGKNSGEYLFVFYFTKEKQMKMKVNL